MGPIYLGKNEGAAIKRSPDRGGAVDLNQTYKKISESVLCALLKMYVVLILFTSNIS